MWLLPAWDRFRHHGIGRPRACDQERMETRVRGITPVFIVAHIHSHFGGSRTQKARPPTCTALPVHLGPSVLEEAHELAQRFEELVGVGAGVDHQVGPFLGRQVVEIGAMVAKDHQDVVEGLVVTDE